MISSKITDLPLPYPCNYQQNTPYVQGILTPSINIFTRYLIARVVNNNLVLDGISSATPFVLNCNEDPLERNELKQQEPKNEKLLLLLLILILLSNSLILRETIFFLSSLTGKFFS